VKSPGLIVDDYPDHHLLEIRPGILAEAPFPKALSASTPEVNRGGIEEDQLETAEQIAPALEHVLFDQTLVAPERQERGRALVRKRFSQEGHRPVKVVQLKGSGAENGVVSAPALTIPIRSGSHQPMQYSEKNRPFDIELEFSPLQETPKRFY
jgi:hypothetical protein